MEYIGFRLWDEAVLVVESGLNTRALLVCVVPFQAYLLRVRWG